MRRLLAFVWTWADAWACFAGCDDPGVSVEESVGYRAYRGAA